MADTTPDGGGQDGGPHEDADKAAWRRRLLAARRALPSGVRAARDAALGAAAGRLAAAAHGPVCAYVPVGSEPGGRGLPDALAAAGADVLLPVVPAGPGPLLWARFDGTFTPGPLGLREPAGARLPASVIGTAALVLVPALAADRAGTRLGRGGGYYDRTLPLAAPDTPLVVLLGEGELVDRLPAEPHDRPVTAALLPVVGLVTLGNIR